MVDELGNDDDLILPSTNCSSWQFGKAKTKRKKSKKKKPKSSKLDPMLAAFMRPGKLPNALPFDALAEKTPTMELVDVSITSSADQFVSHASTRVAPKSRIRLELSVEEILRVLQKDLNTLADQNALKRRRALERLSIDVDALCGACVRTESKEKGMGQGTQQRLLVCGVFSEVAKPLLK
eukprot:1303746-Amorphochlora_amoeboformis.AAC.1